MPAKKMETMLTEIHDMGYSVDLSEKGDGRKCPFECSVSYRYAKDETPFPVYIESLTVRGISYVDALTKVLKTLKYSK